VDSQEIAQRTRTIIAEVGGLGDGLESLADDGDLYEAGLTSRASVSVMLALEDDFDIEFPDSMLNRHTFQTIAAIRDAIATILEGNA